MRCCLQRQDSKMSGARPEKYQNMMGKYFILTFYSMFITARNRSLRRLCFYTCLVSHSVHIGEVSASVHDGIHTPRAAADTHPRKQTPPPSEADTPCAVHAWRYGQQAGCTHPTGMHTCFCVPSMICKPT